MTSEHTSDDPLIGRVLDDRYRIVARLGAGAMGVVYRAEVAGGSPVAVKVLHEELGDDAELRERFEREARALFGLEHPHILRVHDFGIVSRAPYLVMELLEGANLDTLMEEAAPDPETGLEIARQMLRGLAHAHAQGVVHRDIKAENVFVARDAHGRPSARLLDFGLVKFTDDQRWGKGQKLTLLGTVMGSPAYMSPEQAVGAPIDVRSDVYSAGVVLFELLTGTWPFVEEEMGDMMRAHVTQRPPSLGATRPDRRFHPALEAALTRALEKDPDARFADAAEMLAALEALPRPAVYRADTGASAGSAAAPHRAPQAAAPLAAAAPPKRANAPLWLALGATLLAALLGVGALLLWLLHGMP